jgi:DNA polymerase (family 10)
MSSKEIIRQFRLAAALLELHDENPFKARAYTSAIMALERMGTQALELPEEDLVRAGISKGMAPKVVAARSTGTFPELEELLAATPEGVRQLLALQGIGPKKVRSLWKDLGIESPEALREACEAGKVAAAKGFGEKTQLQLLEQLQYLDASAGSWHYAEAEAPALALLAYLAQCLPQAQADLAGALRRRLEVIDCLEVLVASASFEDARRALDAYEPAEALPELSGPYCWAGRLRVGQIPIKAYLAKPARYGSELALLTGTPKHLAFSPKGLSVREQARRGDFASEAALYASLGLPEVPPELREGLFEWDMALGKGLPELLGYSDLQGVLHNHSTYSDGKHSLEEMALHCRDLGYQYLGITDHSQAAFYANGLDAARVAEQQREIEALNERLAPFRIFKGIESDILADGSLDYPDEVLSSFDFIVSSIHSNLKMDEAKATARLIKAIENPYTTILGHPTGRLLLRRTGYPIDHRAVIDACAAHGVAIEINANPWRLDLDWRWVRYALDQGVMLAINPDAHEKDGYADMRYGWLVGRKGGITKEMTLNALDAQGLAAYFEARKASRAARAGG